MLRLKCLSYSGVQMSAVVDKKSIFLSFSMLFSSTSREKVLTLFSLGISNYFENIAVALYYAIE